jgi:hypothetical protein
MRGVTGGGGGGLMLWHEQWLGRVLALRLAHLPGVMLVTHLDAGCRQGAQRSAVQCLGVRDMHRTHAWWCTTLSGCCCDLPLCAAPPRPAPPPRCSPLVTSGRSMWQSLRRGPPSSGSWASLGSTWQVGLGRRRDTTAAQCQGARGHVGGVDTCRRHDGRREVVGGPG